jgi:hypothetical protein
MLLIWLFDSSKNSKSDDARSTTKQRGWTCCSAKLLKDVHPTIEAGLGDVECPADLGAIPSFPELQGTLLDIKADAMSDHSG